MAADRTPEPCTTWSRRGRHYSTDLAMLPENLQALRADRDVDQARVAALTKMLTTAYTALSTVLDGQASAAEWEAARETLPAIRQVLRGVEGDPSG